MPASKSTRTRKTSYLLVDGYNIIFAWNDLKNIAKHSLENARNKLINILQNYQGVKKQRIIVVFDAHKVTGGTGGIFTYDKISVVYTQEAETADQYIEKVTKTLTKDYSITVATSDNVEQIIIIGYGAKRMSARELMEDIKSVETNIRKRINDSIPVKNNQLLDNLDPETAALMEKMRRGL